MPSHRTPRPPRGQPLYLGPRRIPPTGQEHVNQYGRPPAPTPPHPSPVAAPSAPAIQPDSVPVVNRTVPIRVFATWDTYERLRGGWDYESHMPIPSTLEAGDCYFGFCHGVDPKDLRALWLTLPTAGGGTSTGCIDVVPPGGNPPPKAHPRWNWNGSETRATLTPSIRYSSIEHDDYWHGFLTDGVLVGCEGERKPRT